MVTAELTLKLLPYEQTNTLRIRFDTKNSADSMSAANEAAILVGSGIEDSKAAAARLGVQPATEPPKANTGNNANNIGKKAMSTDSSGNNALKQNAV